MSSPDDTDTGQKFKAIAENKEIMLSKAFKILGQLDDSDGAGVVGHNTSETGDAIGVEGATESDEGYGLYTQDDANVGGSLSTDTASIGPGARQWGDRVHLWAVGGQSNAGGRGDETQSPKLDADVAQLFRNGSLSPLEDPVGSHIDDEGSAWPAFAQRYYELSGTPTVWVAETKGGTSITGSGEWTSSGNLRSNLVTKVNEALTHLEDQGYDPKFRGVLWNQGEEDEKDIESGGLTASEYQSAFEDLVDYWDGEFGNPWTMGLFEMGHGQYNNDSSDAIRRAQRAVARKYPNISYLSGIARDFGAIHFTQDQYDTWGRAGAENLLSGSVNPGLRGVSVYQTTVQSISGATSDWDTVQFDSTESDDFGQFDVSNNKFIIEEDGDYLITAAIKYADTLPDGEPIWLQIHLNGTENVAESIGHTGLTGTEFSIGVPGRITTLQAGDELTVRTAQNTGNTHDTDPTKDSVYFSVTPVSPSANPL